MKSLFFVQLWLVFLQLLHFSLAAVSRCYYPNGEISTDYPCDPDADSSPCCTGSPGAVCLSNNLCQNTFGEVIRGSCSDEYWGAAACAHYCLNANTGGTNLISCSNVTGDGTSFCCDHDPFCCDTGDGRFSVEPHNPTTFAAWNTHSSRFVVLETMTTSASSSSSLPTSSSPQPTQTTSQVPSTPEDSPSLTAGAKAGIGVGAGVGGVVIIALAYALWRLRKARGSSNQYNATGQRDFPATQNAMATNNMAGPLSSHQKVQPETTELYGHQYHTPQELPANSG